MLLNCWNHEYGGIVMKKREAGFSLVELMVVCVVIAIISTMAVPNIFRTYRIYQLDASGHSVASLLQQARMQAVKTNLPAYANYNNDANANLAFVVSDPSTTAYPSGNPDVALPAGVTFQAAPPDHAQLDAYLNGGTPQVGGSIGFNARGLPCIESGGNPAVCPSTTAGFEWFMQSTIGWEAVTVTAAGRIKSWRLTQQTGGNSACGYTACWQ